MRICTILYQGLARIYNNYGILILLCSIVFLIRNGLRYVWRCLYAMKTADVARALLITYILLRRAVLVFSVVVSILGIALTHVLADLLVRDEQPQPTMAVAGTTPATLSVSDTGEAQYRIPLEVPPGPGGFAPQFALVYDSGQGDGLLGGGWRIDGLSSLHRCAAALAIHGRRGAVAFDEDDVLCLDGMPLLVINDEDVWSPYAVFRTQPETFRHISRRDGGGYLVADRDGKSHIYGDEPTARIGDRDKTLFWLLRLIRDRSGNEINIHYEGGHSERVVAKVVYGPNTIVFNYAPRVETTLYRGGVPMLLSRRLAGVTMFADGEISREYDFTYAPGDQPSIPPRLIRITECDGQKQCLSPVRFVWNTPQEVAFDELAGLRHATGENDAARYRIGDFNGDDLDDWYVIRESAATDYIYLNQGDGVPGDAVAVGGIGARDAKSKHYHFADFNGDGMTDVYLFRPRQRDKLLLAVRGETPGFEVRQGVSDGGGCEQMRCLRFGDFDGDGRADVYRIRHRATDRIYLYTDDGFEYTAVADGVSEAPQGHGDEALERVRTGDFNGDGKTDVYYIDTASADRVFLNLGDLKSDDADPGEGHYHRIAGPPTRANTGGEAGNNAFRLLRFGDFNGDGLTDVLEISQHTHGRVWVSHGDGMWSSVIAPDFRADHPRDHLVDLINRIHLLDLNGDGRTDIYHTADHSADAMYLSDTTGHLRRQFGPETDTSPHRVNLTRFGFGDFNADGMTDVYYLGAKRGGRFSRSSTGTLFMNRWLPPMVVGVHNGIRHSVRYRAWRKARIAHSADATDIVDPVDIQYPHTPMRPQFVVAQVESDDGAGGTRVFSYRYDGGLSHWRGYGRLGFALRERHDVVARVVERTKYRQDFPYIGAVAARTVWLKQPGQDGGTQTLSTEHRAYDHFQPDGLDGTGATHFAHPTRVSKTVFALDDPGGTDIPVATVNMTYAGWDNYGNPSEVVRSVSGDDTFFIRHEHYSWNYDNAGDNRYYGDLAQRVITMSRDGYEDVAYTMRMEYDRFRNVTMMAVQPGHELAQTYRYEYDIFGNRTLVRRSGMTLDLPDKEWKTAHYETQYDYDETGRFLTATVNPIGQTGRYSHDARTGRVTMHVDAGGRIVKRRLDAWGRLLEQQDVAGVRTTVGWRLNLPEGAPPQAQWALSKETGGRPPEVSLYDSYGRLVQSRTVGFDGRSVHMDKTYNANGLPLSETMPYYAGDDVHRARYEYDVLGRVTLKVRPSPGAPGGAEASTSLSYADNYVVRIGESGDAHTVFYDLLGRVRLIQDGMNGEVSRDYDAAGRLVALRAPDGDETRLAYDTFHRVTGVISPVFGTVTYERDAFGRLASTHKADGSRQYIAYDALGRKVLRIEPEGETRWAYDATRQSTGRLDVESYLGYTRLFSYDDSGRLTGIEESVDDNRGYRVGFTYDQVGRLSHIRRAIGDDGTVSVERGYNRHGYFASITGQPFVSFQSDKTDTVALSLTTYRMRASFYYDMAQRLSGAPGVSELSGSLRTSAAKLEETAGLLEKRGVTYADGSWPLAIGYFRSATRHLSKGSDMVSGMPPDCAGLCVEAALARMHIGAVRKYLDEAGDYVPSPMWRPQRADDGRIHYWKVLARDASGRVIRSRTGNGLLTRHHYLPGTDYIERVVHIMDGGRDEDDGGGQGGNRGDDVVSDVAYRYDDAGNLIGRDSEPGGLGGLSESYDYDTLGRLISAVNLDDNDDRRTGLFIHDYDEAGRPLWRSGVGQYSYDAARPFALSAAGEHTIFRYDTAGRLISGGDLDLSWRSFNKPATVRRGDVWSGFRYDGSRRRVEQVRSDGSRVTYFDKLYERTDYPDVINVADTGGADKTTEHRHYIYAGENAVLLVRDLERGGTMHRSLRYLHYDAHGSVDSVTDGVGRLVEKLAYSPFGERYRRTGGKTPLLARRGFTGHEHLDGLDLIHMNGRLYDPGLGRFLSPDPFVPSVLSTQGYDRYGYAYNNPFKYNDPGGFFFKKIFKSIKRVVKSVVRAVTGNPMLLVGAVAGYYAGVLTAQYSVKSALSDLVFSPAAMANGSYMATVQSAMSAGAIVGGVVGGAVAGLVSGGDAGGILTGALAGGALGALGNYYGNAWSVERVVASATVNGVAAEVGGGKFSAAALASLGGSSLKYMAWTMRQRMIAQSMLNPDNAGGVSDGLGSDGFKLGGGRVGAMNAEPSVLGGHQGGQGMLLGHPYAPGSWQDKLIEAYAGPHDYFNSGYWYDSTGNLKADMTSFGRAAGEVLNWANVATATPFVAAWATPDYMYAVSASL